MLKVDRLGKVCLRHCCNVASDLDLSFTKRMAYTNALVSFPNMPCIILVNPFLDQNVGSVARAMLNFGLTELRVVSPECDILSESARALSVGAHEVLENAKIYTTLSDCISDLTHIMATTIRPRDMTQLILTPQKAGAILHDVVRFTFIYSH
jgi:TrmH family RNA methyltransferase